VPRIPLRQELARNQLDPVSVWVGTHQLRKCPGAPSRPAEPKLSSSSIDWPPERSTVTQPLPVEGIAGSGTSRMTDMVLEAIQCRFFAVVGANASEPPLPKLKNPGIF